MFNIELLRPTIIGVGGHIKSTKEFRERVKEDFSKVLKSNEELEIVLPDLIDMYVSECFSSSERDLFYIVKNVAFKKVVSLEKTKEREKYNQSRLPSQIDYFKKYLRKCVLEITFHTLEMVVDNVEVEEKKIEHFSAGKNKQPSSKNAVAIVNINKNIETETEVETETIEQSETNIDGDLSVSASLKSVKRKRTNNHKKRRNNVVGPTQVILDSVLRFKTNMPIVKLWYNAYVGDSFGLYHTKDILKYFEDSGFVAFSLAQNLRQLSVEDMEVIDVFEKVRLKLNRELLTNSNRRLINQPNGGSLCDKFTANDDLRRAVSITFRPSLASLQIVVEYMVKQFIHIGFVHPDSKAGNALGKEGLELLFKGPGLEEQVPHYDFPCFKDTNQFLSYAHSQRNKLKFDSKLDGGVSLFINHTSKTDYLRRPDGTLIIIPKYSFCILRGNVAHCGTGNSTDDAIFKFFCYIDPVQYDRSNNPYKDSVFLFDEFRQIVRAVVKPCSVQLVTKTFPYLCIYCFGTFHYTNPMCMGCMQKHWNVALTCDDDNRFLYTYRPSRGKQLRLGYVFPDVVTDGFISKEEYNRKYSIHFGAEIIGCVSVSDSHYLCFLEHKSFLATMKKSMTDYNVELIVTESADGLQGELCVTSEFLFKDTELILKAEPHDQNNGVLMVDPDDYAVKDVKSFHEGVVEASLIVKCVKSGAQDEEMQWLELSEDEESDEELDIE
jgi:hypothetical protein